MTHLPWTSISTRSSSGGRTPRTNTRRNEAIFASSRLPFSADKVYLKITSAFLLSGRQHVVIPCFTYPLWSCFGPFSFKPNPMSTPTTVVDENTGEERERLINKGRWKGYGPTSVSFAEKGVGESSFSSPAEVGHGSLMFCMILRRSRPNPHQTSKKCAISTTRPLFNGWKR